MYQLKQDNKAIAVVETPVWVYRLSNGDLGLTDKDHATGISTPFGVYSLGSSEDMADFETVVLNEVDGGVLLNALESQLVYSAMMTDTLIENDEEVESDV